MWRSKSCKLVPLDPKIERTCRVDRKEKREERREILRQTQEAMANEGERNDNNRAPPFGDWNPYCNKEANY